jgi:phenylalanyl-tRNA synthetase beta chain
VDRIEVGLAEPGSTFTTLDGVERSLPESALMILSHRKPVALAGIMGGAETEIGAETKSLLLESANFNAAVIRRCATAMRHRTDASARFEKSLDPANTVLAIQRFVYLARNEWPGLTLASRLSDCYPVPARPVTVEVDPEFANRFMGHPVSRAQIKAILERLEFTIEDAGDKLRVGVPGFRATKDISIEADVIEEIARYVGYDHIDPKLPETTVRSFEPNALHELEQRSLRQWTAGLGHNEIQGYLWYDAAWCQRLGFDLGRCVELRNPIAEGAQFLRQTLIPGLLAAVEHNRHHLASFKLIELGSVFAPDHKGDREWRHLAVVSARRHKKAEDDLLAELRGAVETWSWQVLGEAATFRRTTPDPNAPWQHRQKTAEVVIGDRPCGRVGAVPLALRRRMDEHLAAWAVVWAEIELNTLSDHPPPALPIPRVPEHPQKDLDFSVVVPGDRSYTEIGTTLAGFRHPLLRRITHVASYEGPSLGAGKRSLTFRARIGSDERTLVEEDMVLFRKSFEEHLRACGLELRGAGPT